MAAAQKRVLQRLQMLLCQLRKCCNHPFCSTAPAEERRAAAEEAEEDGDERRHRRGAGGCIGQDAC